MLSWNKNLSKQKYRCVKEIYAVSIHFRYLSSNYSFKYNNIIIYKEKMSLFLSDLFRYNFLEIHGKLPTENRNSNDFF